MAITKNEAPKSGDLFGASNSFVSQAADRANYTLGSRFSVFTAEPFAEKVAYDPCHDGNHKTNYVVHAIHLPPVGGMRTDKLIISDFWRDVYKTVIFCRLRKSPSGGRALFYIFYYNSR